VYVPLSSMYCFYDFVSPALSSQFPILDFQAFYIKLLKSNTELQSPEPMCSDPFTVKTSRSILMTFPLLGTVDDGFDDTLAICALSFAGCLKGRNGIVEFKPMSNQRLQVDFALSSKRD